MPQSHVAGFVGFCSSPDARRRGGWTVPLALAAALALTGCEGDDGADAGRDGGGVVSDAGPRDAGSAADADPPDPPGSPIDAGPPVGACCTIEGGCMDLAEAACRDEPRFHSWSQTRTCDVQMCPDERIGACCTEDAEGGCADGVTVDACFGVHAGEGSTCAETDCAAR